MTRISEKLCHFDLQSLESLHNLSPEKTRLYQYKNDLELCYFEPLKTFWDRKKHSKQRGRERERERERGGGGGGNR